MDGRYVAYYRVSTPKQGESGLGLEAQKAAVMNYLNGGDWTLVHSFLEVESGGKNSRKELSAAIQHCKLTGAKLIIAKLDRMSRDVTFIDQMLKSEVKFVCCDMPDANDMTIGMMSVFAQHERKLASERTKAGLAVIKDKLARGEQHVSKDSGKVVKRLGNPNGISQPRQDLGVQAVKDRADKFAAMVGPTIKALRDGGLSLATVAERLNEMKVQTPRGSTWTPMAVKRVLDRPEAP